MRRYVAASVLAVVVTLCAPLLTHASSLRIAPLDYRATLQSGEKKKGYVDIINTDHATATVHFEVVGFRQTDDHGDLTFFEDTRLQQGIQLDLTEVELLPGEAARIFFLIDGTKLATGDSFAAIMAKTDVAAQAGVAQSVRVGTLVVIQNGTPPGRHAAISLLQAPLLQIGDSLNANWRVTNTDPDTKKTGFFPQMSVLTRPYGQKDMSGPLVMAGRSREVSYRAPGDFVGLIWFTVQAGDSRQIVPIVAATGYWRWLLPLIIVAIGLFGWVVIRQRRRVKKP